MDLQLSTVVINGILDSIEANIGPNARLKLFSGDKPANVAAADAGVTIATIQLPADWMLPASGGTKAMSGTWKDNEADAAGIAKHYRIYDANGVCHLQGAAGLVGSLAALQLQNVDFKAGQELTIDAYVWRTATANS